MSIRYHLGPSWAFWLGNSTPGTDCGAGVVSISRGPLNVRQFVLLVQREFKNLTAYIPTAVHQVVSRKSDVITSGMFLTGTNRDQPSAQVQ